MPTASSNRTTTAAAVVAPSTYRGDLILFMVIAFVLSWSCWFTAIILGGPAMSPLTSVAHLLGAFGPLVAAVVIRLRRARHDEPAPEHAVRFRWTTLAWAPLLLVLASATVVSAAFLAHAAGSPAPSLQGAAAVMGDYGGPAAFLIGLLISGPLSEEPGWRGTAYPRMRASMGRVQVGLILGVIWAVWHLPLFFIDGTVQNQLGLATPSGVLFSVSAIPMTMLTCYAYERAGVLASIAVHFSVNASMVLLGVEAPVIQAMIIGIQAIVVIVLLAISRPSGGPVSGNPHLSDQSVDNGPRSSVSDRDGRT